MNQTLFQLAVVLGGSLLTTTLAVLYFRNVRLERPAIGTFNGRDVCVLFVLITTLPVLYVVLPTTVLTLFLVMTFTSALGIGYRPVVPRTVLWLGIGALLGVNIVVARTMLGTIVGWQVYWALTSVLTLGAAVAVANLYIQGGMRLRHVAWFALGLAVYDPLFSIVIPLTVKLADEFAGHPLDPSIGMRSGLMAANIGIGDLLVYGLFTLAAYKGYGRRGLATAFVAVPIFGAVVPVLAPVLLASLTRGNGGFVVPAQAFFGPAAFLAYLWLKRSGEERSMADWLGRDSTPVASPEPGELPAVPGRASALADA